MGDYFIASPLVKEIALSLVSHSLITIQGFEGSKLGISIKYLVVT